MSRQRPPAITKVKRPQPSQGLTSSLPPSRDPPEQGDEEVDMGVRQSRETKKWTCGHLINCLEGMDDILQGGRDDMRGYGGRAGFTTFVRILTGSFCVFGVFVGFCLVCCFCFQTGEKTPASNSSFTLFAFAYFELTDSLGNAGKKKGN